MENPIKLDDLGVPLFLEIPNFRVYLIKLQRRWSEGILAGKATFLPGIAGV